ncbi:MAG: hypothetical protein ACOVOV_13790, partial [Dolichospermum sp.]
DWTTFNNKQAALTNPVTGTGTNNYIPKFTSTGSTIGDSSLYYGQGANSNSYTFGSVGAGAIYNLSQFNIYSNATSEAFFQWGSNKYLYIGNASGNISISAMNTGTHNYSNIIYYNGSSASDRYMAFETESTTRLKIEQNGDLRFNKYTSNGFLKTSASNGTVTVDTTSYLPLTGGTLTGALSGTSATFNVGSATTVLGLTGNGNGATIASITNTDTGSSARSSFQVTSDSATAHYFASSSTNVSSATGGRASTAGIFTASGDTAGGLAFLARNAAGVITFHTGGNTERVRIAANGETTFNNNVTLANGSDLVITPATSGVNATLYNDIGKLVSTASLVV